MKISGKVKLSLPENDMKVYVHRGAKQGQPF